MNPSTRKKIANNDRKCHWCGSEFRHCGRVGYPWGTDKEGRIRCPDCAKIKNAERQAKWRADHPDAPKQYAAAKRASDPEAFAASIRKRSRIRAEDAGISYCKERLHVQLGVPAKDIPDELALAKREHLFLHRTLKEAKRVIKDKTGD